MYLDVIDLKAFYDNRLGRIASRLIGGRIRRQWPKTVGDRILGIGYATPYLAQLGANAERCLAFMPAAQGIVGWPSDRPNTAALVRDDMLPLDGGSIDRVLAVHCLEHAENAHDTLRDVWRVLAPGGRLLIVVPNRAGMWARAERTPFGHGRPFSRGQLTRLMRETRFEPLGWSTSLAMPPIKARFVVHNGGNWERIGSRIWPRVSGVLIVEATKLEHQRVEARAKKLRLRPVLSPTIAPNAGLRLRTLV